MNIHEIIKLLSARLVCGDSNHDHQIKQAFASDLMSDVLTLNHCSPMLITGLANLQTIRTAEMADISVVVLARGKKATPEMIELAGQSGIALLETDFSVFKTSGILYSKGVEPVY